MDVFITKVSKFLPNQPVGNDDMERYLGLVSGRKSSARSTVLKQNGITQRYYALDTHQCITHTNAELAREAILGLFPNGELDNNVELLACATGNPDQLLPSHASMVHGLLKNKPMEIFSVSGVCLTCLQAMKIVMMSIASGVAKKGICSTSELASPTLLSRNYDIEYEYCNDVGVKPYMAFQKDFLRFMLSDGASALLLENEPSGDLSLRIEWIEMQSFANELPTCMFMGAQLREDGELKGWKEFSPEERLNRSIFVVNQDIKFLTPHIIPYWIKHLKYCLEKHSLNASDVTYVIPHISSMFFYHKLAEAIDEAGLDLQVNKWFTNLTWVGNIACAAPFAALEELSHSGKLKEGDKVLLLVPESGRFSYGTALLTVI